MPPGQGEMVRRGAVFQPFKFASVTALPHARFQMVGLTTMGLENSSCSEHVGGYKFGIMYGGSLPYTKLGWQRKVTGRYPIFAVVGVKHRGWSLFLHAVVARLEESDFVCNPT